MDLIEKTENINRHPWELSRCYNILKLLPKNNYVIADIGAGDQFFTSKLLEITNKNVFAVDTEYKKLRKENGRIVSLNSIDSIEKESLDCIILMDVLEHVEDESFFINNVLEKLKLNGLLIITVPAINFLFSSHDIFLKHYRRYSKKSLMMLLKNHNITIEKIHYFYSLLLCFRFISFIFERVGIKKIKENFGVGLWKYGEKKLLTRLLFFVLNSDFLFNKFLNKLHINFIGLSLLAICKKK